MSVKALVATVSEYAVPQNNLPGVKNDANYFTKVLSSYDISDIEVLRDRNATSANIKTALAQLLNGAKAEDVRIFYFSGHGTRLSNGEAIVPYDCSYSSLILDTWLEEFLKVKVPSGVMFWGVYDCCYSGDMYKRLTFNADDSYPKEIRLENLIFDHSPVQTSLASTGFKDVVLVPELKTSVHIAASRQDQQSLCKTINGENRSVFTWALAEVLASAPKVAVHDLERELATKVASVTSVHVPHISCSDRRRPIFT